MARGRPKKVKAETVAVAEPMETVTGQVETVVADCGVRHVEFPPVIIESERVPDLPKPSKALTPEQEAVAESRKVLSVPLDPSQEFFESPEGFIMIGEKGRGRVWCRQSNGGKGGFINPMR